MYGRKRSRSAIRRTKGSKKLFWKKKKTFRKKPKTVLGRRTCLISSKHLKRKMEMRQRVYQLGGSVNLASNTSVQVWATTGTDGANLYLPGPFSAQTGSTAAQVAAAVSDQGVQGRLWFYQYVTLSFTIATKTAPTVPVDQYRIIIVKQKSSDVLTTNIQTYLNTAFCMGVPIIEKDWKVLYDKVFGWQTGLSTNTIAALTGTNILSMQSAPKRHSFRFPFKYRAQYPNDLAQPWSPPLNTFVLIVSRQGQLALGDITSTQFFTE